jgi:hypothetical protein
MQISSSNVAALNDCIRVSNEKVLRYFHKLWQVVILHALPQNLYFYSGPSVIACDIQSLLLDTFRSASYTADASAAQRAIPGDMASRNGGSSIIEAAELAAGIGLRDFLQYVEQQYKQSNDMLFVFLKEVVFEESPLLQNLIMRHSKIVSEWIF